MSEETYTEQDIDNIKAQLHELSVKAVMYLKGMIDFTYMPINTVLSYDDINDLSEGLADQLYGIYYEEIHRLAEEVDIDAEIADFRIKQDKEEGRL